MIAHMFAFIQRMVFVGDKEPYTLIYNVSYKFLSQAIVVMLTGSLMCLALSLWKIIHQFQENQHRIL